MIIWINGPFGVGKTTTADRMVRRRPTLRIFDPERVGDLLMGSLRGVEADIVDFQDLAAWGELVPLVARRVSEISGQDLVAVQTVLSKAGWDRLRSGLDAQGLGVFQVLLDADDAILRARVEADAIEPNARQWRLDHLDAVAGARSWLIRRADLVIDTSSVDADTVAAEILRHV
ncbi:AAA family ATPase [soil metagenome]